MKKWIADISPNPAPECWLGLDHGHCVQRVLFMGSGNISAAKLKKLVTRLNQENCSITTAIALGMECK